jgi:hypothetical protein
MKLLTYLGDWFVDWWLPILIAVTVTVLVYVAITSEPVKYIQAPIESCRSVYTGKTYEEQIPVYSCASYNKDGVCTMPITTYVPQTRKEVSVTCAFLQWQ